MRKQQRRKWFAGLKRKRRAAKQRGGLQLERLEERSLLATFTVVNTQDSGAGSLRQAILDANASAGADAIHFNIPATDANHLYYKNDGVAGRLLNTSTFVAATTASDDSSIADIDPDWTHSWYQIKPTSALPTITGPLTIDGYTQPGSSFNSLPDADNAVLRIELNGASAGTGSNGLWITAGESTVKGLVINRFKANGIRLDGGDNNTIVGNFIGPDVSGSVSIAQRSQLIGVEIVNGSSGNIIGTDGDGANDFAERNVLSAALKANVFIAGTGADNNVIAGNFIGLNAAGDDNFSNPGVTNGVGVWIEGGAQHNLIGTDADGVADASERNVISGNGGTITTGPSSLGVYIDGASTTDNVVAGNLIGRNATGTAGPGNGKGGIKLKDTTNNRIGSNADGIGDEAERNVIIGNNVAGIELENSTHIQIAGNYIASSGYGVRVTGSSHNTIGGATPGARNVINGQGFAGIYITDSTTAAASHNVISGNYIGTDVTGTTAARNDTGVKIFNAQHNLVGGTAPGAGNVISGNLRGIVIEDQGTTAIEGFNVVEGNIIGLDASGTSFLGNGYEGIQIIESDMNRIGGTEPGARNILVGNHDHAVRILGGDPSITTGNVIQGNWFQTDSAGNGLSLGIVNSNININSANDTLVGGVTPGTGNVFAYSGISVSSSFNTVIQGNVIGQDAHGAPAISGLMNVSVGASWNTLVGGTEPGAGNVIVAAGASGSGGVVVQSDVNPLKWWRAEQSVQGITNVSTVVNTLNGGVSFAEGKYGYAFQFDGVDDYVEVPDLGVDFGSESGIEAWVRPNSVDHVQQMLSKFGPGGNAYQIGITATGALQAQVFVAGVVHTLQSAPSALRAGEWANVGLARDSSGYKLYLNGVAVDSRSGLGVISSSNTTPLSFGRKSDGTEYFDGLIDEVGFYGPNALFPLRYLTGGANKWDNTAIRGNSITITSGRAMGIDLAGLFVTDPGDADIGANDRQNPAEILAATSDGAQVTVQGVLRSMPFATYDIEFFANSAPPPTPEAVDGEQFIGFGRVVTDATGTANFEFTFDVAVPVDYLMSATTTAMSDHDSNPDTPLASIATSEFWGLKAVAPKSGGRIQGFKFSDDNANGQWDPFELPLDGWTIYLDANNNGVLDTNEQRRGTLTNGYSFTNLPAGTYYVREVQQTGWTQTTPEVVEVVVTDPQSRPIYTVNIGNHQAQSLVSGVKFHDLDGDGVRDAGEPGLANWSIYIDENGDGNYDSGESVTGSDVNGVWGFENLPAGTYQFREIQKSGWVQTTADPLTVTLTADGQSADAGAIGNYQLATISGAKFNDRNADGVHQANESGIPGWTIYLDANDNGVLDVGEPSDVTSLTGAYSFSGLEAGVYRIREVQQPTWEQTTANVDVEVLPNQSGQEYSVLVGNFRPSSIIGGVKFHDRDGDGVRDAGEEGLLGWTIALDTDADGTADRFTGTNANGEYSFTGLPAGTYRIREVQESGWVQTTENPEDIVIDEGGQVIAGPSFGNYRLATISGVKFLDCNGNGSYCLCEPGLAGWTIFLDANDNGLLDDGEESDVTDLEGRYSFDNLPEGDYRVREVQQPGWVQTTTNVTTLVLPNVSAQEYRVNIGNAEDHHHNGICVINTNDSGPGSLRQAILDANANPDETFICFDMNADDPGHVYYKDDGIAGQVSPANITVTSTTDDSMIVDFDPDHPYSWWRITPTSMLPRITGVTTIDGYTQAGARENTLSGGLNTVLRIELNGSQASSTASTGGLFFDAPDSVLRGLSVNSYSAGQVNVGSGSTATRFVAEGNFVGVDPSGLRAGTSQGLGVLVFVDNDGRIGTNADGLCDLAERNLISGNSYGINFNGGSGYVVAGNLIGTDITGTRAIPNTSLAGINVQHDGLTIGGTAEVARNVISGNSSNGISITNSGPGAPIIVQGNFIGVDVTGTRALGNGGFGIGYGANPGASDTLLIGGTTPAARNIISGNGGGISLSNRGTASAAATVQGNYVGTDVTGMFDLGNLANGISMRGFGAQIGGTAPGAGNLISGNGQNGVSIGDSLAGATDVRVEGNRIGINADGTGFLGNSQNGVFITSPSNSASINNLVGGTGAGAANLIVGNTLDGVRVARNTGNTDNTGNTIRGNSIHSNGGLGIDLDPNGVTPNDSVDPDTGPNDLQNFPLLSSTASLGSGTVISGSLNSTPSTTFTLDFYANFAADPSGAGEGQTWIGSAQVTTDGSGDVTFTVLVSGTAAVGQFVTATATNPAGSTSEFSGKQTVTSYVPATISGQKFNDLDEDGIKDGGEPGLAGWTIFLDANGNDVLDGGETNVVTNSSGNYSFTGLLPGAYRVREVQQSGWTQTTDNPADLVVLASGATFANVDFGNHETGAALTGTFIVGRKFHDANGNGAQGPGESGLAHWPFFLDLNNDGEYQPYTEPRAFADAAGNYRFAVTSPGTYAVREIPQAGWIQTTLNPADMVVTGNDQIFEANFGNQRDDRVTLISGQKFRDQNGDGVKDLGEPGLPWWPIYIDANNNDAYDIGEPLTFTSLGGHYAFTGLAEGTYRIRELQQPGWKQTTTNPADVVVTTIGQTIGGLDFGNNRDNASLISGRKYFDTNTDGTSDPGEPGLAWWPIFIDTNSSGSYEAGEPLTYTDWNGNYSFVGLEPGAYRVREAQLAGWTQTSVNPDDVIITAAGQTFENVDFGNHRLAPTIISGQKFEDLNDNRDKDPGERGLHYWPIYIDANANDAYDVSEQYTLTNWQGNYSFVATAPGTYRIREVPQSGWRQTTANPADVVVTSTGQTFADRDFGNFRLARIVGVKFGDTNANGLLDPGETGLGGWTIYLDANGNDALDNGEAQTTSGLFGGYSFNNLEAGTYRVREVQQPGWTKTSDDLDVSVVPNVSGQVYAVSIGNFLLGSIDGGVKFHDLDGDGQFDANEPGLPGWTIYLDDNNNGALDANERRTVSDINGNWSFANLPAGTYHVREVQEFGWVQTSAPLDLAIATSGQSLAGGAIGNFRLARIQGAKFEDSNANGVLDPSEHGLEGWTIYLDGNQNGALDDGELSDTTNQFGAYSFDGLDDGTYYVREVQQPGWTQTTSVSVEVIVAPNLSAQVHQVDVGNFRHGTVGGFKFHDFDRDSQRDADEPGLEGWTIYLDANGNDQLDNGERFSITGADGGYSFGNVGPGLHRVREVQQVNWVQTTADLDVTLTSGQSVTGDIGNFRLARIQGVKFEDTNANGVRELGEIGLENWIIYLDTDNNGSLDAGEVQTLTSSSGAYSFDGLEDGIYHVREIQQDGWTQTTPVSVEVIVAENVSAQVHIVNVGNFRNVLVEGIKFHDINRNGVQDSGEPGLEGWTIYLDADGGNDLDVGERRTVSGFDGRFSFANVGLGTYGVREIQQPGWVQTTDDYDISVTTSGQTVDGGQIGNFRLARITGVKFEDTDADGVRDPGEVGLENWTIFIDANLNGALDEGEANTLTNETGAYLFDNLEAGAYAVREVQQPGWTATSPNPVVVTVIENVSAQHYVASFGNFRNGSIDNGVKFHDLNRNGVQDAYEPGLAGWTIFVDADGDNMLDAGEISTVSGADGFFSLGNLGPGVHHIREVQQSGWMQTNFPVDVTIGTSGQSLTAVKLGNYRLAAISGVKFEDNNGDGLRQAGEPGLANWTIFIDADNDGTLDNGEAFQTTGSDGGYSFDNLEAGTYNIREVQQAGWGQTTANPVIVVSANVSGQAFQADFGNVQGTPGKITGGGSIDERVRNFGFVVQTKIRDGAMEFTGSLQYHDKALGLNLHSSEITLIRVASDEVHGLFMGTATVNGQAGYSFIVRIEDNAEPGAQVDRFSIVIRGPGDFTYNSDDYASMGGLLDRGGNIQVHTQGGNTGSAAAAAAGGQDYRIFEIAGNLYVYGTAGDDTIEVRAAGTAGSLDVLVNGQQIGAWAGINRVSLHGEEGNDTLRVDTSAGALPAMLFGGAGNDRLAGGAGNDVLIGGDGNDILTGGEGRDLLVGGFGIDQLNGYGGDDILVAGSTDHDDNDAALSAIMQEWTSGRTFQERVNNLRNGSGGQLNGTSFLNSSTVHDDSSEGAAKDVLTGESGSDWFLYNYTGGGAKDSATDLNSTEASFRLDLS